MPLQTGYGNKKEGKAMAKARDIFGYEKPKYAPLKEPAKRVVMAYQTAQRFCDTVQEWVYIEAAMPFTSRMIHDLAHSFAQRFDEFSDMLHERHLTTIYGATAELVEPIEDMDKAFEIVVGVMDEIQDALEDFRNATDNADFRPMALKTEELMLRNSEEYTRFLAAWFMWDESESRTSFDNWIEHLKAGGTDNE